MSNIFPQNVIANLDDFEDNLPQAEVYRLEQGYNVLKSLVQHDNETVQKVIGVNKGLVESFDLSKDWMDRLNVHKNILELTLPDGTETTAIVIRVQNNLLNDGTNEVKGITGGGVRLKFIVVDKSEKRLELEGRDLDSQIVKFQAECTALARAMTPKAIGLSFKDRLEGVIGAEKADKLVPITGGSKGEIGVLVNDIPTAAAKEEIVAYVLSEVGKLWGNEGILGTETDRGAGDMNTTGYLNGTPVLDYLVNGFVEGIAKREGIAIDAERAKVLKGIITGKSIANGGIEARTDATGLGGFYSLEAFYQLNNKETLEGKIMCVRGCGSASKRTIKEAYDAGVIVKIIGDGTAIIASEKGFTSEDADELFTITIQGLSIADWAEDQTAGGKDYIVIHRLNNDSATKFEDLGLAFLEQVKSIKPDILVEAAVQNILTSKTAKYIPERTVIVELANMPTTPSGAQILKDRKVKRLPGILANAGGVFISWFEYAKAILSIDFTTEQLEEIIKDLMYDNVKNVLTLVNIANENGQEITMEEAYYALAVARGIELISK